jgi:hypothetical protein
MEEERACIQQGVGIRQGHCRRQDTVGLIGQRLQMCCRICACNCKGLGTGRCICAHWPLYQLIAWAEARAKCTCDGKTEVVSTGANAYAHDFEQPMATVTATSDSHICVHGTQYRSGAKYRTTLIIAPANISVLNDVFAWFIVPLIAVGHF